MDTISTLGRNGIEFQYSIDYDPVVYYARSRVLAGNNVDGKNQKPFRGQTPYDYLVWIDSDMVWSGNDVLNLIKHDKSIVSGCYMTADNNSLPIVEHLDYSKLLEQGTFEFLTRDELTTRTSPFTASYVGFGFLAVKYGVFEQMEYPWFQPKFVEQGNFKEFTAEDVGFCWTAKDLGFDIWVDPNVRVGHEKSVVLSL
jgi:GT2 family glycosyltransferase